MNQRTEPSHGLTSALADARALTAHLWRLQAQAEELRVCAADLQAQCRALRDHPHGRRTRGDHPHPPWWR